MHDPPLSAPGRAHVEEALRRHYTLTRESGGQAGADSFYVDPGRLDKLRTPAWQVIFGSEGAGKTILLKKFAREYNAYPEHSGGLAVYVHVSGIRRLPASWTELSERQIACGYFHTLMRWVADRLVDRANELQHRKARKHRGLMDEVHQCVRHILDAVEGSSGDLPFRDTSFEETRENLDSDETDRSGRLGGKVGGSGPIVDAGGHVGGSRRRKRENMDRVRRTGPTVPDYSLARERLEKLIATLGLTRLYLLLDDWSELDRTGATEIQPIFADLLNATFGRREAFAVKITGNRYQCRFECDRGQVGHVGLRLGRDITEPFQLDGPAFASERDELAFYDRLLFTRLSKRRGELADAFTDDAVTPSEAATTQGALVRALFEDDSAFRALVWGAEGNIRRFIDCFRRLSADAEFSIEPRWSLVDVHNAIRSERVRYMTQRAGEGDDPRVWPLREEFLVRCVKPVVAKNASRVFLVDRRDRDDHVQRALRELVDRGLVSQRSDVDLPLDVAGRYAVYSVAPAVWLDWIRTVRARHEGPQEEQAVREISADELPRFVVNVSAVRDDAAD